ncbi:hypothetical protein ACFWAA_22650 [Streptomyces sp. NPDC059922]|uniref:hypothetical protein n=1 Tax=Streptomyces sp. NPDC059922 TaxID=3347005 RepID=UPI0036492867
MAAGGGATAGRSTATMPPGDARTMPAPPVVVFMTDFTEDFTEVFGEVFGEVFIMKTNGPVGRFGKTSRIPSCARQGGQCGKPAA